MKYKIRCYTKNGDLDHEEFFDTLDDARKRRTEWGLSIGLDPEPTTRHFAYYPTIWKYNDDNNKYKRVEGY